MSGFVERGFSVYGFACVFYCVGGLIVVLDWGVCCMRVVFYFVCGTWWLFGVVCLLVVWGVSLVLVFWVGLVVDVCFCVLLCLCLMVRGGVFISFVILDITGYVG